MIRALYMMVTLILLSCGGDDDESDDSGTSGSDGTGSGGAQTGEATEGPAMDDPTFDDQVAEGGPLFATNCARCHGDSGEGTDLAPRLVGDGALPLDPPATSQFRTGQFQTALDVFEFASANMPADDPGSLEAEEYVKILAFALSANGVALDQPLDAALAETLVINEAP